MNQADENSLMELQSSNSRDFDRPIDHASSAEESATTVSLPAADGGLPAWRLLIAAFVFEALLWGQFHSTLDLASSNAEMTRFSLVFRRVSSLLLFAS